MKKIYLTVVGFYLVCGMHTYAQVSKDSTIRTLPQGFSLATTPDQDTVTYRPRRLRLEEINLVSSYYNQNGNHSAVTGGIGTEKVNDFSNGLDLKLAWLNNSLNKNTLSIGLGIDHHTSASAAYVSTTGASKTGGSRIYPSLDWTIQNDKKGNQLWHRVLLFGRIQL